MMSLGGWMNKVLIGWGIDPKFADMFDETIITTIHNAVNIPTLRAITPTRASHR